MLHPWTATITELGKPILAKSTTRGDKKTTNEHCKQQQLENTVVFLVCMLTEAINEPKKNVESEKAKEKKTPRTQRDGVKNIV